MTDDERFWLNEWRKLDGIFEHVAFIVFFFWVCAIVTALTVFPFVFFYVLVHGLIAWLAALPAGCTPWISRANDSARNAGMAACSSVWSIS